MAVITIQRSAGQKGHIFMLSLRTCSDCVGTGRVTASLATTEVSESCSTCNGEGFVPTGRPGSSGSYDPEQAWLDRAWLRRR